MGLKFSLVSDMKLCCLKYFVSTGSQHRLRETAQMWIYGNFFSDLGSGGGGGGGGGESSKKDQLTGHFQISKKQNLEVFFLNISRTNSKTSKVNQ